MLYAISITLTYKAVPDLGDFEIDMMAVFISPHVIDIHMSTHVIMHY